MIVGWREYVGEEIRDLIVWSVLMYVLYAYVWKRISFEWVRSVPKVTVMLEEDESEDVIKRRKFDPEELKKKTPRDTIPCWDPSTMDFLGSAPIYSKKQVNDAVQRAKAAQKEWALSSFSQRRLVMKTFLRFIVENQDAIARVAVRESGKTLVDACFGEILVTCEKLKWLISDGEKWLVDEPRSSGTLMMMKRVHVEYRPFGVIGAIVPWNYPFHNVFNPLSACLFSGNAIVIKVSEYSSWSVAFFRKIIRSCLKAAGAPVDLVQFVTGYGATGNALVTSDVDKIIFVGSPGVGVKVMEAASAKLTPVVLELGGKDPFIVCDDADIDGVAQTACRGVFQNMGQNCAGPERFFIMESVYDEFCDRVRSIISQLHQGPPLDKTMSRFTDCGATTMGHAQMCLYQKLVDDAVSRGARVLCGGTLPSKEDVRKRGSFYPPTLVVDVPIEALIAQEEIFGPIMCVIKIKGDDDDEAVRLANSCDFALSSCVFSRNTQRAAKIGSRVRAGMYATNDLEGTTYMSQSLPFGGRGRSGFGRFAGPEGLRGLCVARSVSVDMIPFLRSSIPAPLQYPSNGVGFDFAKGLIRTFYGYGLFERAQGVMGLLKAVTSPPSRPSRNGKKRS